jgi:hypothetical protein
MPIGNKAYSVGKGVTKKGYPSHITNKSDPKPTVGKR